MIANNAQQFGHAVREARKKQGLSQAALSDLTLVSTHFLSDLEQGKPTIELEKALLVARLLGLEVVLQPRGQRLVERG